MSWEKPTPAEVWRAIETYLAAAYGRAAPPAAVRTRLELLRASEDTTFYDNESLERDANEQPAKKYALRLGNPVYPHMKLVIEPSPG